jgi:hypothetical protein
MASMLEMLKGSDLRSKGEADEVAARALREPELFRELIEGLEDWDPVIRMRAADAAEKASRIRPELLRPFTRRLLRIAHRALQKEVRWHLAQMLPRLRLPPSGRDEVVHLLLGYLEDESRSVKAFSLQSLGELAERYPAFRRLIVPVLEQHVTLGNPAMRVRGRKLLARLRG